MPQEKAHVLSNDPWVVTVDHFLSNEECEHMIETSAGRLEDSQVSRASGGAASSGRTSRTAWIKHDTDAVTRSVFDKVVAFVGLPPKTAENFQVVHYGETNEYRAHYDSWDHDGSEKTLRCLKRGGPRILTALVYLNAVDEGGCTRFTKLNIDVLPGVGKLLVFENTHRNSIHKHLLSEHAGMPVTKGEKYIFNLWFRECDASKLYSQTRPSYYV